MFTLGLETSSLTASIALFQNGKSLEERFLNSAGVRHAQSLVYELEQMVGQHDLKLAECSQVAVSIGPGSFTGLRIGVVCAKTLAFSTGCELKPVDTLLAIAENSPREQTKIFSIADAQRGDLYVGQYQRDTEGRLLRTGEIDIVSAEEFARQVTESDYVCGPGLKRAGSFLTEKCQVAEPELWNPRAAKIALLAEQVPTINTFEKLAALEPFYLRKSAAEDNWEKNQAR